MSILLDDICRCNDDTCQKHETCRRWIDRNRSRGKFVALAESLFSKQRWEGEKLVNKTEADLTKERKHGCDSYIKAQND